jgi:hypothetical protein
MAKHYTVTAYVELYGLYDASIDVEASSEEEAKKIAAQTAEEEWNIDWDSSDASPELVPEERQEWKVFPTKGAEPPEIKGEDVSVERAAKRATRS